ncbi:MAG: FAD-dependent oxidoreductase, partial [Solirubrobacteraceae bacterium]
ADTGGVVYDVYPHMYLGWYHNFWQLLDDAGVARERSFKAFRSIKQLRHGDYPRFEALTDMYSPSVIQMCRNLFAGVGSLADMEVFGYGSFDLLAERCAPTISLDNVSVNGFLQARPYITPGALKAFDAFITRVWALPSYLASAEDYRAYLDYCSAEPLPSYYLPRGSVASIVIDPIREALAAHGAELHLGVEVTAVNCDGERVTSITVRDCADGSERTEPVQELILAVPPAALLELVRSGESGHRPVESAPELAEVSRLTTRPIPILNLCFEDKLKPLPPEPVGLYDSPLNLAFTDISQTWTSDPVFAKQTVLAVTASEPYGLPRTGPSEDGFAILTELARYLDFNPGSAWGQSPAIDWDRTSYNSNEDSQLFINEIGSDVWRPRECVDGLANLSLAGAHCENRIGMTTIESAVTAGLEAARVIVERHGLGAPVEIHEPATGPAARYLAFRYLFAPYAAAAKVWSDAADGCQDAGERLRRLRRLGSHLFKPTAG